MCLPTISSVSDIIIGQTPYMPNGMVPVCIFVHMLTHKILPASFVFVGHDRLWRLLDRLIKCMILNSLNFFADLYIKTEDPSNFAEVIKISDVRASITCMMTLFASFEWLANLSGAKN
jgi:hypothetical protein